MSKNTSLRKLTGEVVGGFIGQQETDENGQLIMEALRERLFYMTGKRGFFMGEGQPILYSMSVQYLGNGGIEVVYFTDKPPIIITLSAYDILQYALSPKITIRENYYEKISRRV